MAPKISIIIPVYNVAPYLRRCLDSVLAQTVADWEAICVDDGSTDGSGAILDEYAAKDGRFKVVHQENKGVAAARQVGLDAAVGDWIASVDPDDWVGESFLANMYKRAIETGADMVWTDFSKQRDNQESGTCQRCAELPLDMVKAIVSGLLFGTCWNRLFSRKFIVAHGISFVDRRVSALEDLCFVIKFLSFNPVVRYAPGVDYHYVYRVGSAIHYPKLKSMDHDIRFTYEFTQRYIEEALAGFDLEQELTERKIRARFMWFSNPAISDECFYGTFPEVKTVKGCDAGVVMVFLFWISLKGYRRLVLFAFKCYREMKRISKVNF